jgi:hypothetical protein
LSRALDAKKGLGDFVRLCFTKRHPMMFSATKDGRLAEAVVLEVDLDVVSLPGVLFANRNAAASRLSSLLPLRGFGGILFFVEISLRSRLRTVRFTRLRS